MVPGGAAPESPSPWSQDLEHREAQLTVWQDGVCLQALLSTVYQRQARWYFFSQIKADFAAEGTPEQAQWTSIFKTQKPSPILHYLVSWISWQQWAPGNAFKADLVKVWLEPCHSEVRLSVPFVVFSGPPTPLSYPDNPSPLHSEEPPLSFPSAATPHHRSMCRSNLNDSGTPDKILDSIKH